MLDNFFNLPVTKSPHSKINKKLLNLYQPVVDNTLGMSSWLGYFVDRKMSLPKFIKLTKGSEIYTIILESSFIIQQEWYRLVLGRGDIYSNIVTRPSDLPIVDITAFSKNPTVIYEAASEFAAWQVNKFYDKKPNLVYKRNSSSIRQRIIPLWLLNTELAVYNTSYEKIL